MEEYQKSVKEWHFNCDQNEIFKPLRNDAQYRILVALLFNLISPFSRPWRQRAQFQADFFKPANQVACSEFVIKVCI